MGHFVLPDWVFRFGWGTPGAYEYLQLRMEAAQLDTSRLQARAARNELNSAVGTFITAENKTVQNQHHLSIYL